MPCGAWNRANPCEGEVWVSSIRIQSRPLKRAAPQHAARLWRANDRLHIAAVRPHSNGGHPDPSDDTSRRERPGFRSLFQLDELSQAPELLLELPNPESSAKRVALEGGRYPSSRSSR